MSQNLFIVPLHFLDGTTKEAVATGNNAAWLCNCERKLPLLGRTGLISRDASGYNVDCPCCRSYYVVPKDKDLGKVYLVKEV